MANSYSKWNWSDKNKRPLIDDIHYAGRQAGKQVCVPLSLSADLAIFSLFVFCYRYIKKSLAINIPADNSYASEDRR